MTLSGKHRCLATRLFNSELLYLSSISLSIQNIKKATSTIEKKEKRRTLSERFPIKWLCIFYKILEIIWMMEAKITANHVACV